MGVKHYRQILEIAERLQYDSPCIQNEALLGISKLKQVKRSADNAKIDEEQEPENTQLVSQDEERFENTIDFVQRYKETRNRMNWRGCHDMLKNKPTLSIIKPQKWYAQCIKDSRQKVKMCLF